MNQSKIIISIFDKYAIKTTTKKNTLVVNKTLVFLFEMKKLYTGVENIRKNYNNKNGRERKKFSHTYPFSFRQIKGIIIGFFGKHHIKCF
jgi:hypothetical protein